MMIKIFIKRDDITKYLIFPFFIISAIRFNFFMHI